MSFVNVAATLCVSEEVPPSPLSQLPSCVNEPTCTLGNVARSLLINPVSDDAKPSELRSNPRLVRRSIKSPNSKP